jgi:hypothetical protein
METQTSNLSIAAFDSLPDHVKDWLSSTQATHLVMEINGRLGLKDEKETIIPGLIFRLVTQNIEPLDFINELSHELGVSFQTAKSIAQDIEEKVLKPIENELRRDVGVDVKLIYFGQPSPRPTAVPTVPAKPTTPAPIPPPISPAPAATPISPTVAPVLSETPKPEKPKEPTVSLKSFEVKEEEEAPFILHQETPSPPAGRSGQAPSAIEPSKIKPGLTIKIKDYYQDGADQRGSIRGSTQKPVAVKVETPNREEKERKIRVVHYNGNRTPINNLGLSQKEPKTPDENTVDLRKIFKK